MNDLILSAIVSNILDANAHSEKAYWSIKNISSDDARRLDIETKLKDILTLLHKVDNLTMDIVITFATKSNK